MDFIEINNYIINLGSSDVNEKIYHIKTKLSLSTTFKTFPFGANKMRFQYEELFNYTLNLIEDDTKYRYYSLVVSKKNININNCPHNQKFFKTNGWELNLVALNVVTKNINNEFISTNEIYQLLPNDYGTIELFVPNKYIKPIVGIVVPVFNRFEYLSKFLESLNKTNLSQSALVFMDESLSDETNIDEDKKKTNELIKKYKNDETIIIKIFKKKHGNMFDSILTGLDMLATFCYYLSTIDSDTIHSKNWIDDIINTFELVNNKVKHDNILLSGFNTVNCGRHTIIDTKEKYVIKNSVGGCHLFFNKKIYYDTIRCSIISYKWDTNIVTAIKRLNEYVIITTKPSVVEHIGYVSSGHRNAIDNTYDISVDFINI